MWRLVTRFLPTPQELGRDLDQLVSERAEGAVTTLRPAYAACQEVQILWHHWAASDRKQACLAELDAWAAYFEAIGRDGGTYFRSGENVQVGQLC